MTGRLENLIDFLGQAVPQNRRQFMVTSALFTTIPFILSCPKRGMIPEDKEGRQYFLDSAIAQIAKDHQVTTKGVEHIYSHTPVQMLDLLAKEGYLLKKGVEDNPNGLLEYPEDADEYTFDDIFYMYEMETRHGNTDFFLTKPDTLGTKDTQKIFTQPALLYKSMDDTYTILSNTFLFAKYAYEGYSDGVITLNQENADPLTHLDFISLKACSDTLKMIKKKGIYEKVDEEVLKLNEFGILYNGVGLLEEAFIADPPWTEDLLGAFSRLLVEVGNDTFGEIVKKYIGTGDLPPFPEGIPFFPDDILEFNSYRNDNERHNLGQEYLFMTIPPKEMKQKRLLFADTNYAPVSHILNI